MSVSKQPKSNNCSVTFLPHGCVFQDLQTGRKIGGGAERGGLYYLTDDAHPQSVALLRAIVLPLWQSEKSKPEFQLGSI